MEDVRTFMLLEGKLCLKVLPLAWIIFSEIPNYLKDEDNENIYFTILPNIHEGMVHICPVSLHHVTPVVDIIADLHY